MGRGGKCFRRQSTRKSAEISSGFWACQNCLSAKNLTFLRIQGNIGTNNGAILTGKR